MVVTRFDAQYFFNRILKLIVLTSTTEYLSPSESRLLLWSPIRHGLEEHDLSVYPSGANSNTGGYRVPPVLITHFYSLQEKYYAALSL